MEIENYGYYATIKSQLQSLLSPFCTPESLKNPCEAFTRLSLHSPENDEILLRIIVGIDDHFYGIRSAREEAKLSDIGRARTPFFQLLDEIPHEGKLESGGVKAMILVIAFLLSIGRVAHVALPESYVDVFSDDHTPQWQLIEERLKNNGYKLDGLNQEEKSMLLRFYYVMYAFFSMPRAVTEHNKTALIASTSFLVGCDGCTRGTKLGGIRGFFEPLFKVCADVSLESEMLESILEWLRNPDNPDKEEPYLSGEVRLVVKKKIVRSREG
eukprot:scaffold859_cov234-Ochromonas_danica.AAC.5